VVCSSCKLFYMLNNEWKERGVGHLYLKPSPGDKTQLLIRSDNTLGLTTVSYLVDTVWPHAVLML